MNSEHSVLEHVPFSVFAEALQTLRLVRGDSRRSAGRSSYERGLWRSQAAGASDDAENDANEVHDGRLRSKEDVLAHMWKEIIGCVSHSMRESQQSESESSNVNSTFSKSFQPATALPECDTVTMLCLLAPQIDCEHPLLYMKAPRIAEHYIEALDLRKNTPDAKWLLNFHDKSFRPDYVSWVDRGSRAGMYRVKKTGSGLGLSHAKHRSTDFVLDGNFPSVLRAVLHDRCRRRGTGRLSVARVWQLLGVLYRNREAWKGARYAPFVSSSEEGLSEYSAHSSFNSESAVGNPESATKADKQDGPRGSAVSKRDARVAVFRELINEATADENVEFVRIILKDLEVRLPEDRLLRWFHRHAKQFFAQTHDLKRLVAVCRDPDFVMDQVQIEPGNYVSVMLTARPVKANLFAIARRLSTGFDDSGNAFFYMEPKLDGERMQLHKIASTVRTFTRSAKESSAMYAKLFENVVLDSVKAKNVILDGEIVIWDEMENTWVRFENFRNTILKLINGACGSAEKYTIKYVAFDILYVEHEIVGRQRSTAGSVADSSICWDRPRASESHESDAAFVEFSVTSASQDSFGLEAQSTPATYSSQNISTAPRTLSSSRKTKNSLVQYPLSERRRILLANVRNCDHSSVKNCTAAIEVGEAVHGSTESDLTATLGTFVDKGFEGLIAKSPGKPYGLGERDAALAIKLKPDYFEGGLQDIDVIVLGAKYGRGTGLRQGRIGTLSSFLIGARTYNSSEARRRYREMRMCKWTPIGSVGTGYNVDELERLQAQLEGHWHDLDRCRDNYPSFWSAENSPDYMFRDVSKWIDPRDSVVLQVRAYELVRSQGLALRFPRCDRIRTREEKPFFDAISVEELIELDNYKTPAFVASASGGGDDEILELDRSRKVKKRKASDSEAISRLKTSNTKVTRAGGGSRAVMDHMMPADVSDISTRGTVLKDFRFHVLASLGLTRDKHEIERCIYKLGGTFEQSVTSETTHYIAVESSHRVVQLFQNTAWTELAKSGARILPIIRPCWIKECLRKNELVPLERRHVIFATPELDLELLRTADRYGDDWETPVNENSIVASFNEIDAVANTKDDDQQYSETDDDIEQVVANSLRKAGLVFFKLVVYAPHLTEADVSCSRMLLEFFGAEVWCISSESEDCNHASHVLIRDSCADEDLERIAELAPHMMSRMIVSDTWVRACVDAKSVLPAFYI